MWLSFAVLLLVILSLGRFVYPEIKRTENSCVEFKTNLQEACVDAYPPKGRSATVCANASEDHFQRFRLSLANKMYLGCSSWCVYDITDDADTAYMWNSMNECWEPAREWLCFAAEDERRNVQSRMRKICQHKYHSTCEENNEPIDNDSENGQCIQLHDIDAVNEPARYNRMLRCKCHEEGENSVIRLDRTAVHCNEESWSETSIRIELALLNGMFLSCENWCLFDIFQPNTRYWTWNPWGECWDDNPLKESVCDTIVAKYGEEIQFALERANSFCSPLVAPSRVNFFWSVGGPGMTCTATCAQVDGGVAQCSARAMVAVNNDANDEFIISAFAEAGVECKSISAGDTGITGTPAYRGDHCITTGGSWESGLFYCNRAIAAPYIRLCACTR